MPVETPTQAELEDFAKQVAANIGELGTAINELDDGANAIRARLLKLELKDAPPPPPPPDPDPPVTDAPAEIAAMPVNSWLPWGDKMSSIAQGLPPLNRMTRGVEGWPSVFKQWSGGKRWGDWIIGGNSGGHRAGGINPIWGVNLKTGKVVMLSKMVYLPDLQSNGAHFSTSTGAPNPGLHGIFEEDLPDGYDGKAPLQAIERDFDQRYGSGAYHGGSGQAVVKDKLYMWGRTGYDGMGLGDREKPRIWGFDLIKKEWFIARDSQLAGGNYPPAFNCQALDDRYILVIGQYFKNVFDTETGEYVGCKGNVGFVAAFGNLVDCGEETLSNGIIAKRFLYYGGYERITARICFCAKDKDGQWSFWGKEPIGELTSVAYTHGSTYWPEKDAVVLWRGGKRATFVELGKYKISIADYDELDGRKSGHLSGDRIAWLPDWGVFMAVVNWSDQIMVFKPPLEIEDATKEPPPVPIELQDILDGHKAGDTVRLPAGTYRPATVRHDDLTIECEDNVLFRGQYESKGCLVVFAKNLTVKGGDFSAGHNSDDNASCVWGDHGSGGMRFEGTHFHDSDNGILTSKHAAGLYAVIDCTFTKCGSGTRGHAYYDSSITSETYIEGCTFDDPVVHFIKSRALKTTIIDNKLLGNTEEGEGAYSRLIDIPEGGHVVIQNNFMEHGHPPGNDDAICIGCEYNQHGDRRTTDQNSNVIIDNVIQGFGSVPRLINVHGRYPAEIEIDAAQIAADNEINGFEKIVSGR